MGGLHNEAAITAPVDMNKVITISIDQVDLKAKMALSSERAGDLEKAEAFANEALQANPDNVTARLVTARICRRNEDFSTARKLLYTLIKELPQSHEFAATLHFEIAEVYDRTSHFRQALIDWKRGNQLQANRPEYKHVKKVDFLLELDELRSCDYHSLNAFSNTNGSPSPIFMVGFPRSGTTLLHHMLEDHPDINVLEEVSVILSLARRIPGYPASLHTVEEKQVAKWREEYWQEVAQHLEVGTGLIVDKLPLSMVHLPLIKRLFPKAKIVLSLRHPCDCVLSNFTQRYSLNNAMMNFSTLPDAIEAYAKVIGLWNHYRDQINFDCHEVHYEKLVENVKGEQQRLLEFLGLEQKDELLHHQSSAKNRFVSTPSYFDVRQPIFTRSVERWRNYANILDWPPERLRPFIRQFDYEA